MFNYVMIVYVVIHEHVLSENVLVPLVDGKIKNLMVAARIIA